MSKITRLVMQKKQSRRINVFLDGEFAFSLEREVAVKACLRVGQELTAEETLELTGRDRYTKCYNAACRFLSFRPRSEQEVRQRLQQHGYDEGIIDQTIARLKELRLINDTEFARLWTDNRDELSPRSRRLIKLELRQKGLSRDIIEQAVGSLDEDAAAYRAALKKAKSLPADDYKLFRERMAAYLGRRGFGYETLNNTIKRIWKEHVNSIT